MPLSSTSVVIWWIENFWKKKSAVYPSDNLLFWTNAKKILTVISFIAWENSRNFPIGWSLLQPISTNNRDLGGVASSVCFFLRTFLRRHFAWMASRNVGCYRRLYLSRFPVVVIVFFVVFLVCVISWCDVCLSVFLQESSENPNPLAKAELNLLAHLVGGANKKTESKLIPKIQNKIRL